MKKDNFTKRAKKIKVHRKLHLSLPRIGILEVPRPNLALARSHPKTAGEKNCGRKIFSQEGTILKLQGKYLEWRKTLR